MGSGRCEEGGSQLLLLSSGERCSGTKCSHSSGTETVNIHVIFWKFMLEHEIVIVTGSSLAHRLKNILKIVSFPVFSFKIFSY